MHKILKEGIWVMKKILSLLLSGIMAVAIVAGCGRDEEVNNPTVTDATTESQTDATEKQTEPVTDKPTEAPTDAPIVTPDKDVLDYGLADRTAEGAILHCWNWSYNNIKEHMQEIAQAGFSSIQTSPIQQAKDYTYEGKVYTNVGTPNGTGGSDGQWWKLYQPVTFNICDNGQSFLGTKDEFKQMCEEAEKYGVKVIVDVVANHLGNISGWKNSMSDITPQVGEYWKSDMMTDETYWHINSIQCWMSDGRSDLTLGTIGMPDLNTADKRVQNMVLDFLKECVDCGADGFRFDAAKHIETPDDSASIASDFWPTVINGIREYADHELFIYGEILNTPGDNFSINNYTKYMSVTDSATGDNRRNDVRYKNASSAANPGYSYDASKCVVWNESHDTYVGAGSSYLATDTMIKQTWAIIAARKEATPLFLARSYYSEKLVDDKGNKKSTSSLVQTEMGDVGTMTFSDPSVAAVNNFKNAFIGQSEHVSCKDSVVYVERGTTGAVIVNLNGAGTVNLKAYSMKNGTYTDRVSGNIFTVEGGFIKGEVIGKDGIAVIYETETVPYAELSKQGGTLSEDQAEITITLKNGTNGTYSIDGGKPVEFTGEVKVTVGDKIEYGESTMLTVTVTDGTKEYVYKHEYNKNQNENSAEKFDENSGKNLIYMKNTAGWEEVYCYMWTDDKKNNAGWPGLKMTELADGTFLYATDTDFPNVIFNNGNGTQTADLKWPGNGSIYDNEKNKFQDR
jgi:alpha-amylase